MFSLPLIVAANSPALADFKVRYPTVVERELEIESYSDRSFDGRATKSNAQSHNFEVGYGVTGWWQPELEVELAKEPQGDLKYNALTLENRFQLLPQGEYWLDLGVFAEYSRARLHDAPDEMTIGPLAQKQFGNTLHTLNLLFTRQVGQSRENGTFFQYAWQSKWLWKPQLEPGFEVFGDPGKLGHFGKASDQDHRIGPSLSGGFLLPQGSGKLKYEVGYLIGVTDAAASGVAKLQLEYELFF
ncbi:MAG TPA: hypothetical protein VEU47_11335 [Candidatus Cybelea sp.]|nr:hypothetical protein [Candidatus Cybelea sp.]